MAIVVNLDVMMAKRKMTLSQLSEKVDITLANLSILKNNKAKAVRFSTLEAICAALDCQPGDILEYVPDVRRKFIRSYPADTALYAKEDLGSWATFGICSTP